MAMECKNGKWSWNGEKPTAPTYIILADTKSVWVSDSKEIQKLINKNRNAEMRIEMYVKRDKIMSYIREKAADNQIYETLIEHGKTDTIVTAVTELNAVVCTTSKDAIVISGEDKDTSMTIRMPIDARYNKTAMFYVKGSRKTVFNI